RFARYCRAVRVLCGPRLSLAYHGRGVSAMNPTIFGRVALIGAAAALCSAAVMRAQTPARVTDGATFTASGAVVRPADYREWVYLTAGLGMSYAPEAQAGGGGAG